MVKTSLKIQGQVFIIDSYNYLTKYKLNAFYYSAHIKKGKYSYIYFSGTL